MRVGDNITGHGIGLARYISYGRMRLMVTTGMYPRGTHALVLGRARLSTDPTWRVAMTPSPQDRPRVQRPSGKYGPPETLAGVRDYLTNNAHAASGQRGLLGQSKRPESVAPYANFINS